MSEQHEKPILKSIKGRRCLTTCKPKGTKYLHPILLTSIKNNFIDTCAIDPIYSRDILSENEPSSYKDVGIIFTDKCNINDNDFYAPPDELESILLSFYFNPIDFLQNFYGLYS